MGDKENRRKCIKCGCSPANDHVKLYRFPKPGIRNLVRCELWAKYMFPDREYSSINFQAQLHNEHHMLCHKHFKDTDFANVSAKQLFRHAVPSDTELQLPNMSETSAGTSRALMDVTNTQNTVVYTAAHSSDMQPVKETQSDGKSELELEKENKLYAKCHKYMRRVCQLKNRLKNVKNNKAVLNAIFDDESVRKLSERLTPSFALLLQAQIRNFKKKINGRRWSKEEKILALRIYKRSPTCYRLLRRLFYLPAPNTLKNLLNNVPFGVGINQPVFKVLSDYVKTQKPEDNKYVLMFDEMSLKKHLHYNVKEDMVEGYQDHGVQGRTQQIASYALVFMVAGIRKKVKQPIAHYFSSGSSSADRLAVLLKEVVHQCFTSGINISATVCDMDGVNRRALSILGASVEQPYIKFEDKEIITMFDTPHLLKCFRNLFLKYDIECPTNISSESQAGRGIAKWCHIKEFYEVDNINPNFVFAPVLKKDHLEPNSKQKMKVKLAAQVLSHSVAAGMYAKISQGQLTSDAVITANVIASMDKLFDAVNSDSSDLRRGKTYATNMTQTSPHLKLFEEMRRFFKNMKYIGSPRTPPSQEGWVWTLNALERLWAQIKLKHKSLATRRIQQDPLENLFGCIRGNCGANANPTTGQFVAGLKTAVLGNLSRIGTTGNCERDNNIIIDNFKTFMSQKTTCLRAEPVFPKNELIDISTDDFSLSEDTGEIQACAYVCGFLYKNIPRDCKECVEMYISQTIEKHHIFVQFKEYSENKKSLNYIKKDIVDCVERCATVINNILNEKSHNKRIKTHCIEKIRSGIIDFDFLNQCQQHKQKNIDLIVNNVFHIIMKRYCILKNRIFSEEASASALKRKMNIILHK